MLNDRSELKFTSVGTSLCKELKPLIGTSHAKPTEKWLNQNKEASSPQPHLSKTEINRMFGENLKMLDHSSIKTLNQHRSQK